MNRRSFISQLSALLGGTASGILFIDRRKPPQPPLQIAKKPVPIDPNNPLLGYKGQQFLEAGIVYAPSIHLFQTCDLVDKMPIGLTNSRNLLLLS